MSDYLTTLPMELIHKIMEDVPTVDILSSFGLANKRLRSASLAYSRLQPDFGGVTRSLNKNQFDCICIRLLHSLSQVISLTLFDKDDPLTPAKNALFFSRFSCIDSTFSNLRSLTLTYISYNTWCSFKTRLPSSIVVLSIHLVDIASFKCPLMTSAILGELLFFSPTLERLSVKMSSYSTDIIRIRPLNSTILSSVQYFHLDGIVVDLSSLFAVMPMLHTLEIRSYSFDVIFGNIHPRPLYLQRLRIELWVISWTKMATLLSSFPRLNYLKVTGDDLALDMADGFAWASLLKDIKHFECYLQFHWYSFDQQSINLDSFCTKFWLEEKKWFVTYDPNVNNDYSVLYTNSSSVDDYLFHPMIGIIESEPNGSEPHVYCSTISYQYLQYASLHRYTYITNLKLSPITTAFPTTFNDLITYLDTSRIITGYVSPGWIRKSPYELAEFLRSLSYLRALSVSVFVLNYLFLHQWPDIIHLRIEHDFENNLQLSSLDEIDALCRSFTHIERLDIHLASVTCLPQLLNKMNGRLTDIIIRQPLTESNEPLITRKWIEQNTELEHFHYTCDEMNSVSLWC